MSGINQFHEVLREINRITAWVMPTAAVAPFISIFVGLNPPWPNKVGLTAATSIVVLLALIFAFQMLRTKSKRLIDRTMLLSLVLLVPITIAYFTFNAFLVYTIPLTGEQFVKGFQCIKDAEDIFGNKCPWLDLDELKEAEYEATRLWTFPSIVLSRLSLLFFWFASFTLFALILGAFVCHQSREKVTEASQP